MKRVYPFLVLTIAFTLLFLAVHRYANTSPKGIIHARVAQAITSGNLLKENYPVSGAKLKAPPIQALIGQNHYTECELIFSALANTGHSLKDSALPSSIYFPGSDKKAYCPLLESYLAGEEYVVKPLRTRYMWGSAALMGVTLRYLSVFQKNELVRQITTFSIFFLAVSLCFISLKVFIILSPLLVFTIFFSGATYYSDFAIGLPFSWSLLGPAFIALGIGLKMKKMYIDYISFSIGAISSFIWLIDGHTMQMITWLMLVVFSFNWIEKNNKFFASIVAGIRVLFYYCFGFICCYFVNQLIKTFYLGGGLVWSSFEGAFLHRVSDSTSDIGSIVYFDLLERLWNYGFFKIDLLHHDGLAKCIIALSFAALFASFLVSVFCMFRSNYKPIFSLLFLMLLVLFLYFRFFILKNHSWIHVHFIGRYLFIVPAICWVSLIMSVLCSYKNNQD